jgi:hypothetical protein
MGNGAIGNGAKNKQAFKYFLGGVKDGIGTVLNFGKDIFSTPGVTDAINMGARSFGVPVPVGDMISSGVDIASNLFGGRGGGDGSQRKDILRDTNKYDFMSGVDQFSSLIKRKVTPIWKK